MEDKSNPSSPPLPTRHPSAPTPAEIHSALEREQEAIVNRLTRDLSALRAQNSAHSVLSSSSSSAILDSSTPHPLEPHHSATVPASSTTSPHPSSASTSTPGAGVTTSSIPVGGVTGIGSSSGMTPAAHTPTQRARTGSSARSSVSTGHWGGVGVSQASVDRARDAAGLSVSTGSNVLGGASGPPLGLVGMESPRSRGNSSSFGAPGRDVEAARAEVLAARAENEALVRRVRELERLIREERARVA